MRRIVVGLAGVGVAGQALVVLLVIVALLALVGVRTPFALVRKKLKGRELWLASMVAAIATGGSLFFSEVAHFPPCELCWYERYCMYPLSIAIPSVAAFGLRRASRWLLPLPFVGAGVSIYHLLIENGLLRQSLECMVSAPGGCGVMWIDEFGYMTIPTLALTGFVLIIALLLFDHFE